MKKRKTFEIRNDYLLPKEIGKQFKQFRKAIDKTHHQLAEELNMKPHIFADIENGLILPGIDLLHYFNKTYNLDCNWLLTGEGSMTTAGPALTFKIPTDEPGRTRYEELNYLMKVPEFALIILGKLQELEFIAADEIKEFKKRRTGKLTGQIAKERI